MSARDEYDFRALGRRVTAPSKELDTFPAPRHVSTVRFTSEELTSFCPVTEQPDFNRVEIEYRPDELCVESKSLKLYLWSFREERIFGETLASTIAQDLVDVLRPHMCKVKLIQNIRGGMQLTAVAEIERGDEA
ncbi:MAG: preQ(1) synthase [Candidatus Promineifilaceae bacterium]|nr:preQ(1) synthase [Candidatus Promineifilaceae bacterium]